MFKYLYINSIHVDICLQAMDELCGQKPWVEPVSTASSDQNDQPASSTELGPIKKDKGIYSN